MFFSYDAFNSFDTWNKMIKFSWQVQKKKILNLSFCFTVVIRIMFYLIEPFLHLFTCPIYLKIFDYLKIVAYFLN